MSLLTDLMRHPLDEDYARVTRQRQATDAAGTAGVGGRRAPRGRGATALLAVLTLFGLLVATAAVQQDRRAPVLAQERAELISRIDSEEQEVEELRATADSLEREVAGLEEELLSRSAAGQRTQRGLDRLGVLSGALPVSGPGVVVVVDDAPGAQQDLEGQVIDTDLQRLVNALWVAGAEAVSINSQRLTSRTAIRGAGSAITVNYRSLTRPYVVRAIGDPDTLPARLLETSGGQAWLDLQVNFGIEFRTESRAEITVPGREPLPLRYARPPEVTR